MQKKKGISLVTLVITIIIMIILAGAIILSLSDSNIFDRASEIIDEYNLKQIQSLATLKWMDIYLNPDIKVEDYADYIKQELEKEGIDTGSLKIEADNTHVTVTRKEPEINYEDVVANEELNGEIEIDGIKYKITKGVANVTGHNAETLPNEVVIPSVITYDNTMCRVMSVGNKAFEGNTNITSLVIKKGIVSIGYGTFEDCSSLNTIGIPEGVTSIGFSAFSGCSELITIDIPNGVTIIEMNTFYNCSNLTTVTVPDGVTSIGSRAFYNCSNLTTVNIPDSVTSIGWRAFMYCSSLVSIELSNGITSIGVGTFTGCSSLTTMNIPTSLTSIGEQAFKDCGKWAGTITIPAGTTSIDVSAFNGCNSLTAINVDIRNNNYSSEDGVLFDKEKTVLMKFPAKNIIKDYVIPSSVISIKELAFENCSTLTTVIIPGGINKITGSIFVSCSLTEVTILDGVTSIGWCAFNGWSNLKWIVIPASVTSIDSTAFSKCPSLKNIYYGGETYPATVPSGCTLHLNSTGPVTE